MDELVRQGEIVVVSAVEHLEGRHPSFLDVLLIGCSRLPGWFVHRMTDRDVERRHEAIDMSVTRFVMDRVDLPEVAPVLVIEAVDLSHVVDGGWVAVNDDLDRGLLRVDGGSP